MSTFTLPLLEKFTVAIDDQINTTISKIQPINTKIHSKIEEAQDSYLAKKDQLKENVKNQLTKLSTSVLEKSIHIYDNQKLVKKIVDYSLNAQDKMNAFLSQSQQKFSDTKDQIKGSIALKKQQLHSNILKLTELVIAQ